MKKSLAVMLALIMVLCMIPTTAFAADIIDQKNSVSIYKGEPTYSYFLRNFPGGSITKQKNEEVTWQRLPRYTNICNCGRVLEEVIPDLYCINPDKNIKITNPEVIGEYGVRVASWKGNDVYNGYPCFEFYCKAAKAGETDVTVTYYYNYNYRGASGYCNNCGRRVTVPAQTTWYEEFVTFHVKVVGEDPVGIPDKPTDISGIVGESAVKVHCTNSTANHTDKSYGLKPNSYTVSEVEGNATNGYTCTITVKPGEYVSAYNGTYSKHTLVGPRNHTINLKWNETDKKWVVDSALPVVFNVKCDNTQPPTDNPPTKPEPENTSKPVAGLTGKEVVRVECTTTNSSHAANTYPLIADSYTVGEVQDDKENGYTCEITVEPAKYVAQYNLDINVEHKLDPESQIGKIKLKWKPDDTGDNTGSWEVVNGVHVVFDVKCKTQEPPTDTPKLPAADVIPKIVGKDAVKVLCTTNAKHAAMRCDLLENSFNIGVVTKEETSGEYFCNITVHADKYVEKYNEYLKGHTLETEGQTGTITLNWDAAGKQWKYTENKLPITFTVKCETVPEETYYIVTYTDGVGGTAFVDQAIRVKSGDPTPAFNGTPSRSGYTFTGWTPAVTDTVTDNVTYTAQWKNNDNHTPGGGNGGGGHYHPTTTPVPVIVIPPKTGDMTIWQSILHFLGIR